MSENPLFDGTLTVTIGALDVTAASNLNCE